MSSWQEVQPYQTESETVLDDMIREIMREEARQAKSSPAAWLKLLQRAQTEVDQLPPGTDQAAEEVLAEVEDKGMETPNPSAILAMPANNGHFRYSNLGVQIAYQRQMVEMKMWRTIGRLGLSFGTI